MNKILVGADPELFMQDANGAFVSAIGRIGGSKKSPRPLPIGDGFAVQEDNVAVEYNIPPADSRDQFVNYIGKAMSFLSDEVSKLGLHFVNVSATSDWSKEDMARPEAHQFGCDPDFNAWLNGERNPRPKATDTQLRTCGGHVHVGIKLANKQQMLTAVKMMDLFLSVPACIMDHGELRKQLYGKAGAYRRKPYGFEYRSLSNFWALTPEYTGWVFDATQQAMDALQNNKINPDDDADLILSAVNNNDKGAAYALIEKHNLMVV